MATIVREFQVGDVVRVIAELFSRYRPGDIGKLVQLKKRNIYNSQLWYVDEDLVHCPFLESEIELVEDEAEIALFLLSQ